MSRGTRSRRCVLVALTLAASNSFGPPLSGQGASTGRWQVRASGFVWLANVDGRGRAGAVPVAVGDSSLRAAPAFRLEVTRGRVGITGEYQRAVTPALDGSAVPGELAIAHWEAAALLRLGSGSSRSQVDAIAGFRYVRHDRRAGTGGDATGDAAADWLEPFGGVRFASGLGGPFRFAARGNIGGLGIGSSFTWVVEAELGIRVLPFAELLGRYRYSEAEFESGSRLYEWDDGQVQGWYFGLGIGP